ncbi:MULTISPECIES: hypothetical protein [Bacillus]|uniref:hypothetical protein n=1 Tax=Bacillus TaxID=1386 RepID=UPI000A9FA6A7|nr:hypothetical protein [Bacillus wiedmannii]HDR7642127.1 hypothetical protein [Bacillus wiedmannii]HDR7663846.1 hypothetical protein [Bacillus wiedmannii]
MSEGYIASLGDVCFIDKKGEKLGSNAELENGVRKRFKESPATSEKISNFGG